MQCIIPGANVKVFGRAIHSLSKIGEELYIEALDNGLSLRTVNAARSAYTCFLFAPAFFSSYNAGSAAGQSGDASKCKINTKSCVSVFKSLSVLEKSVDKCKISMQPDEERLVFQLYCHHGIVKTHRLLFIECDSVQAVFAKHLCPNVFTAQTRLFCDAVANFQTGQEEISLIATPIKLTVKNYVDDEPDPMKAIRTELSLTRDEFDSYNVGVDAEVTFCLKEFRAALSFSEPCNLPLSIYFESAGKPIIFSVDGDATFEANFVLATLAVDLLPSSQCSSSQQLSTPGTTRLPPRHPQQHAAGNARSQKTETVKAGKSSTKSSSDKHLMESSRDTSGPADMDSCVTITDETVLADQSAAAATTTTTTERTLHTVSKPSVTGRGNTSDTSAPLRTVVANAEVTDPAAKSTSRLFDLVNADSPVAQNRDDGASSGEEGATDNNAIPGTPPSKKFKSMFFGLSQSTTAGSQTSQPPPVVLAEDSEED